MIVLAVNYWDEDKETLAQFARDQKLQQKILLNGSSVGKKLYDIPGVPSSFWINREGIIVDSESDFEGPTALDKKTRKLIASH